MRVVCAWCGKIIEAGDGPISHGVCEPCVVLLDQGLSAEAIKRIREQESDEAARRRVVQYNEIIAKTRGNDK